MKANLAPAGSPVATTVAVMVAGFVIIRGQGMNVYGFAVVVLATLVVIANVLSRPPGSPTPSWSSRSCG